MNWYRGLSATGLLLAFVLALPVRAQHADRQPAKYWIYLSDKLDGAGKATLPEADYLTERARQRRSRRGTARSSTTDAPLSPAYLDALRAQGVTPLFQSRWLNAVSARLDARRAEAVRALPFVRAVRPVARLAPPPEPQAAMVPTAGTAPIAHKHTRIDYGPSQGQLELINAVPALERGINGTGVRIGFLDTRYDLLSQPFDHPALRHIPDAGRLIEVRDFTEADQQATGGNQSNWHGMSVASVAVGFVEGQLVGPAYGAEVLAATTEFAPFERNVEEDNFVAGLEWLESQGVDVVNTSLGYNIFDAGERSYTKQDLDGDTGVTTVAFDFAASLGVVVVSSAGNEGSNSWGIITTPADGDSVIAVGGVTSSGTRVSFSSTGPTADNRIKPDVAAQGSGVYLASISGGYTSSSGTSFSSPIVAGVAAQMLQVNPDLGPFDVLTILRETASQANNPDNLLGWGIIDADAAIRRAEELFITDAEEEIPLPDAFVVRPPYPNPFSEETIFDVQVPARTGLLRLSIYNLLGQRVDVPFEGAMNPGVHRVVFQAASLPPGLYLYRLEGEGVSRSGKVDLVR